MGNQHSHGYQDLNQRNALNIDTRDQLRPLLLVEQTQRTINHENDARPEQDGT